MLGNVIKPSPQSKRIIDYADFNAISKAGEVVASMM
jgi:hypothetical protein